MDRGEVERYILETYDIRPDFPWMEDPSDGVLRHPQNRKWFGLLMEIPYEKIGVARPGVVTLLNVKCDPILIGSLRQEPGIYPAYHMNKNHWISIALDGTASDALVTTLLDMSFALTAPRPRRNARKSTC